MITLGVRQLLHSVVHTISITRDYTPPRELLKGCRQVKHCKKGFRAIFQLGLTVSYVCT